ncbi:tripartite tricarboxylate transporter TctB family protein [Devosia sp. 1566]|uniref:tripartite tricarboxylate transporter TctB family protein n=1 Tax=Devosia sp. 1566 TaxID=2499144 RepID=UPI000FDA122D|nr:tripartite tricarboxylate transporter TctB family protein [Devosia sp. 1566]
MQAISKLRMGHALLGAFLMLLALAICIETLQHEPIQQQAVLGPTFFPLLISAALALNGIALVFKAFRRAIDESGWLELQFLPVLIVLGGLMVSFFLLETAGWVICSAITFTAAAAAFGERRQWINVPVGLIIGVLSFFIFNNLLGLSLPGGWIIDNYFSY